MAVLFDTLGNEIRNLDALGGETLTDARVSTATLAAVNAEVLFDLAGHGAAAVDVRGTFGATLNVEATVDGTNYFSVPVFIATTELFQVNITTAGTYFAHLPAACRRVRVRMSAFSTGSAVVALRGSVAENFVYSKPIPSTLAATITAASGVAATLTIPAPAAGLFIYINRLIIQRFAAAALTAGATPLLVTSTNLPGSRVFSMPADAALQGTIYSEVLENSLPLKSVTAATAVTIVAPATPNVIWRITVDYYVGA